MTILVTGAAGFIGSALVLRLLARGDTVIGIDNHNDYFHQRQNQNNDMSFAHLLSSRRAWTKGRAEPEGVKLFQNRIVLLILLITSGFGGFFRFDPRQEVQIKPSVAAG
jgi:nucleoside-diphosphate-sugar epimerase